MKFYILSIASITLVFGSVHCLEIKSKLGVNSAVQGNYIQQGHDRNGNPIYHNNKGEQLIYNGRHYYKMLDEDEFEITSSNPQHKHGGKERETLK